MIGNGESKTDSVRAREVLGNNRRQSQQSRLELGLRLSRGLLKGEQSSLLTRIAATGNGRGETSCRFRQLKTRGGSLPISFCKIHRLTPFLLSRTNTQCAVIA
jgi:hypothetical protein